MHELVNRILHGEKRAVARVLTLIENEDSEKPNLLSDLYPYAGRAHIIGVTGAPGAGKSTLVDQLIRLLRGFGLRVGVLAVDPSSPFTGGALLGDRVRMSAHSGDEGVYIRSMGSRGNLGGLGKASKDMLYVLEAYGCDAILLETVGVGQAELDVMSVADTVALVLTPGSGDAVQTAKAGIMEIADLFVLNKSDLPGATALLRELRLMISERLSHKEDWVPPVVSTTASDGEGLGELWSELVRHRTHLKEHGYWEQRRKQRFQEETLALVHQQFRDFVKRHIETDRQWQEVLQSETLNPYESAKQLLSTLPWLKN
ncbi:methylmalonyl Co-A mutase-associated GTPase MeaB [Alicyclobacillus tolerans]|uniref:methylmalonyl Co-A mutase-associated GTPase MeaB n=1 Tax=Alicyclobacillus tolerans TaxID=90970 RepID=UPI001F0230CE|nr:methylmalonyl Co-A mutase-associated GTPase MeaB [Alicyclobacillus tolerans]MCF8565629.1 methylmalonyl Co-A mutase-associated GTPase MeaB [Alicyclobacillus tolerans]